MLKKGDSIWRMIGRASGDKIYWDAEEKVVVSVNNTGWYKLSDGSGGSPGNVGKNIYLTKEDAIKAFLKKHDELITEKVGDEKCKGCPFYVVKGTGTRLNAFGQKEHIVTRGCSIKKCSKS